MSAPLAYKWRTKRGALARYSALLRKYRRDFAGGFAFGMDMRTLAANAPAVHDEVRAIIDTYERLPD